MVKRLSLNRCGGCIYLRTFSKERRKNSINPLNNKNMEELIKELQALKDLTLLSAKTALTMDDAALLTGLSKSHLYKLCCRKAIPYYKNGGKLTYFDKGELTEWLLKYRVKTNDELAAEAVTYVVNKKVNNKIKIIKMKRQLFHLYDDTFIDMEEFEGYLPVIEKDGKLVVYATNLFGFLDGWSGSREYQEWFWDYTNKCCFKLGIDYDFVLESKDAGFDDYTLSLNMAKIIAMLDDPYTGSEVRRYLAIQEKEFEEHQKPVEVLPLVVNSSVQQEKQNGRVAKKYKNKNV